MNKVKLITNNVIKYIKEGMYNSSTIYILTAFVMKSGVELLNPYIRQAIDRGADVKICTGDYLYVTQPEAMKELISIHPDIEVRMWRSNGTSFHPKAYIFHSDDGGTLIVGSSNLSYSALTTGVEWNLSMDQSVNPHTLEEAMNEFAFRFYHDQTVPVNQETIKKYEREYETYHQENTNLVKTWTKLEEQALMLPEEELDEDSAKLEATDESPEMITPRPVQQQALDSLQTTMEEGYNKAMVVMATGLGKTYLAAFFAQSFKRILFIAHREEILFQARISFQKVMTDRSLGLYYRDAKEGDSDVVFASVYTLGMKKHLESFNPSQFDLIIVDEFHHAAANSYKRALDYFDSEFLLGITATPDRLDGKDVYALCDGNVAFHMHFIEAIQRQWLVPFQYYGVYDETDYSKITWLGTKYEKSELLAVQLKEEMAQKILEAWEKYKQTRTLVFCSNIEQAVFLADYFNDQGYKTVSLHSKQIQISRKDAINQLEKGQLDAIFTVDLFNEGVDIPSVDTLLFVRPTESLTIFTQQIGRGLRLHPQKKHCTIIDLIGNYRNADVKLSLLDTSEHKDNGKRRKEVIPVVPDNCTVDLDVQVVDLLKEFARKRQPRKEKLFQAYMDLKQDIGRRPTYLELHLNGKVNAREYRQEFKSYVGFLNWADELDEQEKEAFQNYEFWLQEVERTSMSKSYKMVVLKYMLSRGIKDWVQTITAEEAAPFFRDFYKEKKFRMKIEFEKEKSKGTWLDDEKQLINRIKTMPMTKWSRSSKRLIQFEDDIFQLTFDIEGNYKETIYEFTKEICEYRLHEYFEKKEN